MERLDPAEEESSVSCVKELSILEYDIGVEPSWTVLGVSAVLTATVFGMAFGGWMSGEIYDWTGSYAVAFVHGIAWNGLNLAIAGFLLFGRKWSAGAAQAA